jgi:Putative lumazine-binding
MEARSYPNTNTDEAAVVAKALDYFEGWFDGDTERMDRALHRGLAKRSLSQVDPDSPELRSITKERMLALTASGQGKGDDPGGERRIDVWKIVNALWHFT